MENARQALIGGYALSTQSASAKMIDAINCVSAWKATSVCSLYIRQLVRSATADDILKIAQQTFTRETATLGVMRGTTEKTDAEKLVLGVDKERGRLARIRDRGRLSPLWIINMI